MVKRALGYIRVSRDREGEKLSPKLQRRRIADYCGEKKWDLVKTFADINVSGGSFARPGWNDLMAEVQPGDVIVCNEYTRIGRSLLQTLGRIEELHERGVEIASLEGKLNTTTSDGRLHYQLLLVIAENERNRLSERLRQTHEQIAREGRWKGGGTTALGYKYTPGEKVLKVEPSEAETVKTIYELRDKGWSIRSIVQHLDGNGTRGKKGRMNYTSVRSTLSNPVYISKRLYKGELLPMNHEPIIPQDLWERVQARNRTGESTSRKYLLSSLLVCGDCGSGMVHQSMGQGKRQLYNCKAATEFKTGRRITIEEHIAEKWVMEKFFDHIDPAKLEAAQKKLKAKQPKRKSDTLKASLKKTDAALDRLLADYYDSEDPPISPEQFRKRNAELQTRRDKILAEIQGVEVQVDIIPTGISETWPMMTLDEKREALRLFIDHITVMPTLSGKGASPDRLKIKWKV